MGENVGMNVVVGAGLGSEVGVLGATDGTKVVVGDSLGLTEGASEGKMEGRAVGYALG